MPNAPIGISEDAIERLLPYADGQSLRDARIRTAAPWAWMPRLLGAGAVTLRNDICMKPGLYRETDAGGLALLAHECRHVRQYRELGTLRFLLQYLIGAIQVRFVHDAHPLELEPEAIQARALVELA